MVRVAAQIAAIVDPTGVASTVGSYTYPTCAKLGLGGGTSSTRSAPSPVNSQSSTNTGVNGRNVTRVDYGQGAFQQTGEGLWVELNAAGQPAFRFSETGRDDWSVYLHDASRNLQIQIDLYRKWISYGTNHQARTDLYQITQSWR